MTSELVRVEYVAWISTDDGRLAVEVARVTREPHKPMGSETVASCSCVGIGPLLEGIKHFDTLLAGMGYARNGEWTSLGKFLRANVREA